MSKIFIILLFVLFISAGLSAQDTISVIDAKDHIGETKVVCGEVMSTHYAKSSNGKPTFLNLDKPYPKQEFTIVIWNRERFKFPANPDVYYENKHVCVKGEIEEYGGVPQVVVCEPESIQIWKN